MDYIETTMSSLSEVLLWKSVGLRISMSTVVAILQQGGDALPGSYAVCGHERARDATGDRFVARKG
jgi:hypothetical protein